MLRAAKSSACGYLVLANLVSRSGDILVGVPKLNIGAEQEPIGAGFAERHADLPATTRLVPIIRSNGM